MKAFTFLYLNDLNVASAVRMNQHLMACFSRPLSLCLAIPATDFELLWFENLYTLRKQYLKMLMELSVIHSSTRNNRGLHRTSGSYCM